jgi:palmitoyltransferase
MLIWSILVTATTDPGKVPIYWGFYFGDSDLKRKRYCLMCNVFKPERCHHCSICNRCVLNMDHHCPWINNCVGFYNRKFFIQMLFYLSITLIFTNAVNAKFLFETVLRIYRNRVNLNKEINETLGFLLIYFIDLVLNVIIVLFFKFHLIIVLENKTTIETIDKKTTEFNSIVIIFNI